MVVSIIYIRMKNLCPTKKVSYDKIAFFALLLALPFFLTACSLQDLPVIGKFFKPKESVATNKPITLTVWGLWENQDVINAGIKKYQEKHPNITIKYEDRSLLKAEDYKETVIAKSKQAGAPDVVLVHNTWVPSITGSLSPAPSELISTEKFTNDYYPSAVQSAITDGKIYAVPAYYDGLALVYNKKHFEAIDQKSAPTSWEEFRNLAAKLRIESEGKLMRAGAAIGNSSNIDFASDIYGLLLMQADVELPLQLDTSASADALTFYTNFVKEDKVWNDTFPEASVAFAREQVSMIFVPSWNLNDIVTVRPDLEIGVAPVPQIREKSPVTWGSFWMWGVTEGSTNKASAWDFARFMAGEEGQMVMFNEGSTKRKFGAPYALASLSSQLSANQYLKAYVDVAPYSKSYAITARSGNKDYVDAIKAAISAVVSGEKTSQVALKEAKLKLK